MKTRSYGQTPASLTNVRRVAIRGKSLVGVSPVLSKAGLTPTDKHRIL